MEFARPLLVLSWSLTHVTSWPLQAESATPIAPKPRKGVSGEVYKLRNACMHSSVLYFTPYSGLTVCKPILLLPKAERGASNTCPQRTKHSLPKSLPYYHGPRFLPSLPLICKFSGGRDQDNWVPGSSKEFNKQRSKERRKGGEGCTQTSLVLKWLSESPGGLVTAPAAGPYLQSFRFSRAGRGLRICVYNKFLSSIGPGSTFLRTSALGDSFSKDQLLEIVYRFL